MTGRAAQYSDPAGAGMTDHPIAFEPSRIDIKETPMTITERPADNGVNVEQ